MVERDKKYLNKFVDYIEASDQKFNIFFAPKGEALIYDYYKIALIRLSNFKNSGEIVIQTNLSCDLDWLENVNTNKLILWASYHPKEVESKLFLEAVKKLISYNIRFTIGAVGIKENFNEIKEMNNMLKELSKDKHYMWINAYKDEKNYYSSDDIKFLSECDPLFQVNLQDYKSKGLDCKTGEDTFFLDWNGNVYRCFQNKIKLINIYKQDLNLINLKSTCENNTCGCFIGYSNIKSLNLHKLYRNSLLGRIP